ncbi:MAG TPA: glycosyltransferase [Gemmatimonadaceae bacterium]|nr:glycosyltransferase [Gemmatimonadaceae bacterium]
MLYICIPSYNEAPTVGVLLWRIRKVFQEFSREYEVLVFDDGSTDATAETLAPYRDVMPLTVLGGSERRGYAVAVDALCRAVAKRTRYPRRDAAIFLQADFTDQPEHIPELVKRFEGGADVVVAERPVPGAAADSAESVMNSRLPVPVQRLSRVAPWLLKPFVSVPGVRDPFGSFRLYRIAVLRDVVRAAGGSRGVVVAGDPAAPSWGANAELLLNAAAFARRVEAVSLAPRYDVRVRETRIRPFADALGLFRFARTARSRRLSPAAAGAGPGRDGGSSSTSVIDDGDAIAPSATSSSTARGGEPRAAEPRRPESRRPDSRRSESRPGRGGADESTTTRPRREAASRTERDPGDASGATEGGETKTERTRSRRSRAERAERAERAAERAAGRPPRGAAGTPRSPADAATGSVADDEAGATPAAETAERRPRRGRDASAGARDAVPPAAPTEPVAAVDEAPEPSEPSADASSTASEADVEAQRERQRARRKRSRQRRAARNAARGQQSPESSDGDAPSSDDAVSSSAPPPPPPPVRGGDPSVESTPREEPRRDVEAPQSSSAASPVAQ